MLGQKTYINPNIINKFLFFYFILMPFAFVKEKNQYILSVIIAFIGYIAFTMGYSIKLGHKEFLKNEFKETKTKQKIFALFVFLDFISIVTFAFKGINQDAYNIGYLESAGSTALYWMILTKGIFFAKYYIYSGYLKDNKRLFSMVFFISMLSSLSGRVRFDIIRTIVFFVIYGVQHGYLRLSILKILSVLIVSPIFMLGALVKRDFVGSAGISHLFQTIKDTFYLFNQNNDLVNKIKMSMESFATFEIYNNVISDNLMKPMSGIFRLFFNFIPRSIWSSKPYPLQVILAYEYNIRAYLSGGGVFANLYGDAYLNGGVFAVVLILFVLGVISKNLYTSSIIDSKSRSLNVGLYCMYITFFINFYRGYLSDMTWQFLLLIIIFKFLNVLEKYKFSLK